MQAGNKTDKQSLLNAIKDILGKQLPAAEASNAAVFSDIYFKRIPAVDLAEESAEMDANRVINQLKFIHQRKAGELLLRVYNTDHDGDSWECRHTIVEICNDDMPFLVDTANMVIQEMELGVHLIVHPVFHVERDKKGKLQALYKKPGPDTAAESFIHMQIDKHTDKDVLAALEATLRARMAMVRTSVDDWGPMKESLRQAIEEFAQSVPNLTEEVKQECIDFLKWVADDHFLFIGARQYDVLKEGKSTYLKVVDGSGLGLLRENPETVRRRLLSTLSGEARFNEQAPLIITKTNSRSPIHRSGYMDYIGVLRFDKKGKVIGEYRFIGLFTSLAYLLRVLDTPLVSMKARTVLENSGMKEDRHAWKSLLHILETLPRDDVLQASSTDLLEIATGVLDLQERKAVRLFIRRERFGRFFSCLVYIPRDYWNTETREKIQRILMRALDGERLEFMINLSESELARLQIIIRPKPGANPQPDVQLLEEKIIDALRSWNEKLTGILLERHDEEVGLRLARTIGAAFPPAYMDDVSPWVAAYDVEKIDLLKDNSDLQLSLYRPRNKDTDLIRFKVFKRGEPIFLSNVLPILEALGLHIMSERPYELKFAGGESVWVHDFEMVSTLGKDLDVEAVRDNFQEAFENIWRGKTASDGFNGLILACRLDWRQVKCIRAYCKYLLQTGITYSQSYMEETLSRHPFMARLLVELFDARFNPARDEETDFRKEIASKHLYKTFYSLNTIKQFSNKSLLEMLDSVVAARLKNRQTQITTIEKSFRLAMATVSSLDEDRILSAFYEAIQGTLRTNYYKQSANGGLLDYMSFKFDSSKVPNLPKPIPYREIWVFSSHVEGIHLRGGVVARGGLRWSDRKEDFRTEVLGLLKAQSVKNTIIVPVGAKGGFVVKRLPENGSRDEVMAEVVRCYKIFINGMLDITDNLVDEKIVPPEGVLRLDGDDPYLVVAADKGTATFSDTANAIALERNFWLGDAFASGGSVGYDHKGMAITASGAWESVKRHFREMGINTQKEPFTVVGIGDMSGDVFGNGMLMSRQIRLQAAFNHMHIFLDPSPDAAATYRERKRLFYLPRSGWNDFDPALISKGGGVFSRAEKSIPLSKEVRTWLGVEEREMAPSDLIRKLLTAEVDLLWNGGIGTYVKAASESNADVGDAQNNLLRVNGGDMRCKVIGEGGNLGMTQLGRIEYAKTGGRLNTDFIDNSAGVDCSDHEVNIKILLSQVVQAGKLSMKKRNELLAEMTDEVARLVLRSNYMQTQTISMMERLKGARLGAKQHFITVLERAGLLDRELENLPSDEELTRRRGSGEGMYRPELAVLMAYSKVMLYGQILESDVPEDPWLSGDLIRYFPEPLQQKYSAYMGEHRLKREIIATQVTNSMVNRMGASFVLRMHEDTGANAAAVARAFTIAREIFRARDFWSRLEKLDNKVDGHLQIDATLAMWKLLRQATRWVLNQDSLTLDIQAVIDRLAPGMLVLEKKILRSLSAEEKAGVEERAEPLIAGGMPRALAQRAASLHLLYPALDVVETAASRNTDVLDVAAVFFGLGDQLGLKWLRASVETLPVDGQWHAHARANLRDELNSQHRELTGRVLEACAAEKDPVKVWMDTHLNEVSSILSMVKDMERLSRMDYATVSVAVGALKRLLATSKIASKTAGKKVTSKKTAGKADSKKADSKATSKKATSKKMTGKKTASKAASKTR